AGAAAATTAAATALTTTAAGITAARIDGVGRCAAEPTASAPPSTTTAARCPLRGRRLCVLELLQRLRRDVPLPPRAVRAEAERLPILGERDRVERQILRIVRLVAEIRKLRREL